MVINLVVAATENNVIGKDNKLLWHLPNDMAFFKNTTWGMPVIMGRKTYESMQTPLKGRTNIIISRNRELNAQRPGTLIAADLQHAIQLADETDANECYVIGGGEIFQLCMDIANRIYLTRIHTELEGDVFFPAINENKWGMKFQQRFEADKRHAYAYTFQTWEPKIRNT